MEPRDTDRARRAAARFLDGDPQALFVDELTSAYPWLRTVHLFRVMNVERAYVMVAVDAAERTYGFQYDYPPTRIHHNLKALNAVLEEEGAVLPDGMSPVLLATTVRHFTWGGFGFVGSPAYWEQNKEVLYLWMDDTLTEGAAQFERFCEAPRLERSERSWVLTFHYFNPNGGVERWEVVGDQEGIKEAVPGSAAPDGTFTYPYF